MANKGQLLSLYRGSGWRRRLQATEPQRPFKFSDTPENPTSSGGSSQQAYLGLIPFFINIEKSVRELTGCESGTLRGDITSEDTHGPASTHVIFVSTLLWAPQRGWPARMASQGPLTSRWVQVMRSPARRLGEGRKARPSLGDGASLAPQRPLCGLSLHPAFSVTSSSICLFRPGRGMAPGILHPGSHGAP